MLTDICSTRTGTENGNMKITQHLLQFTLIFLVVVAVKKPACQCK